ncbi:MAG: multi-sensor signal transduction histidine kinase [Polaromonas sp.]|jgi:PAS domain S-box-containing protein|nr:multi-sensor signal transduction histidine kinase [Polaromonas sp.]
MKAASPYPPAGNNSSQGNVRTMRLATALVLALGLSATAAVLHWQQKELEARAQSRFRHQVERIEADAQRRLNQPFMGLKAAAGVFAASRLVQRDEFRTFVNSSNVGLEYPGIRGFGFVERVKRSNLKTFVAAQRRDGRPAFALKLQGPGTASELYVVKFMEPAESSHAALGIDLGHEPVRKQAIEQAITSGEATISGLIHLVQDEHQRPALLFLLPIYRHGFMPVTVQQRQDSLVGVLAAPVILEEIMADIASSLNGQIRLAIYDRPQASAAAPDNLLIELGASPGAAARAGQRLAAGKPMFETSLPVLIGGRQLTLRMSTTAAFEAQQGLSAPWLLVVSGILLSSLLALSIWLLGSGRARAEALALRMTADLAYERQRLLNIMEGTNVGTWVWDVQVDAIQLDERWAAMMGYTLAELGTQRMSEWRNRVPPEEQELVARALYSHFRGETGHFECEHRIRHRKGHWVWVLDRGKVSVWTPAGQPHLMSGMHMDISDRQSAQLALRTSEENFRQLFESSLHGILQAMPNGDIQYANFAACKLFRLTQDEIRQRGRDGLVELDDSRLHILVAQARMSGHGRGELIMKRGDGSRFECELTLTSYQSPTGQFCNNLFLRDITKRKKAEAEIRALNADLEDKVMQRTAQLEAANKDLEAFSYSVAHDLRAPLRSIDGFTHLLEKTVAFETAARTRHYMLRIRASVRQMGELTDGLLSLAQVSRTSLKKEAVDLSAVARRVLEAHHEQDAGRVVNVHVETGMFAQGDAALLHQVMENLLGNAWKFTANSTDAAIYVGRLPGTENGMATYFVQDNGAGFDMAYVDKLFGTFQRLHSPGEFSGTGIGLATTHRIVTRHDGQIWAEGRVDEGATFFFSLPCASPAAPLGQGSSGSLETSALVTQV